MHRAGPPHSVAESLDTEPQRLEWQEQGITVIVLEQKSDGNGGQLLKSGDFTQNSVVGNLPTIADNDIGLNCWVLELPRMHVSFNFQHILERVAG